MIDDGKRANLRPFIVEHALQFMLSGLPPSSVSGSFRCSSRGRCRKDRPVALIGQRRSFPSDAPQYQPFGRCDAKINGNHGLFNRFTNLVFIKLTHGEAEQCIGHATYLIPKEGLAGDLKADQAASIHPRFGFKHGSNRIFPSSKRAKFRHRRCPQRGPTSGGTPHARVLPRIPWPPTCSGRFGARPFGG